jgi:hypothetical protein
MLFNDNPESAVVIDRIVIEIDLAKSMYDTLATLLKEVENETLSN